MSVHAQALFVVVQGPMPTDAEFASHWLAAVVEADRILQDHKNANPDLDHLKPIAPYGFSDPALQVIHAWLNDGRAFALNLDCEELYGGFAYMTEAGFFTQTDRHYRMTHPGSLTSETIARALLQLAETKDEDDDVHPELLLTTMSREEAHRNVLLIEYLEKNFHRTPPLLATLH